MVIIGCGNLVVEEGRVLLVREAKPSARGRFNLPAGKPEVGETLMEAAVREAKEETGLDVVLDHLVGIYQCPDTSEGTSVTNFVFASHRVGGDLQTSVAHPEVRFFDRVELADLARRLLLRGTHILAAIEDHAAGQATPLSAIRIMESSPLP
ncbi:MAG TPA: NUDIX hydrolase [Acidimicrobiales bacterium]|nr:NUDIX hydrolase [Acidimicrobiales bacterium]